MSEFPAPQRRDYGFNGVAPEPDRSDASPDFVSIMPSDMWHMAGLWTATWNGVALLGEFEGTHDEAVAWARERSEIVYLFSVVTDDVHLLAPDAPAPTMGTPTERTDRPRGIRQVSKEQEDAIRATGPPMGLDTSQGWYHVP